MRVEQVCEANVWDAISAMGTAAGAVVALAALFYARHMLIEAKRARKVTLSITLAERFSRDEMHKALAFLGQRRTQYKNDIPAMCVAYVAENEEAAKSGKVSVWSRHRRMISKFFISAYALCKERLLEPDVLAEQIQRGSIELYVQVVAPLDETHAALVQGRKEHFDHRVRDFFSRFIVRQFDRAQ